MDVCTYFPSRETCTTSSPYILRTSSGWGLELPWARLGYAECDCNVGMYEYSMYALG